MKKVLIIESCWHCKHRSGYLGADLCTKTNSKHSIEIRDMRVIPDVSSIPDWCDLPNTTKK